ncbi:hypothetical protein E2C01_006236 [Portunus trituberculatus]|uniref:Uncharacterized protein n=1 Tax=Portunus trituberculatus TaxID=210409 RepID=A0A5B7CWC5_PORTR|nr:hypothetical protein [Portunus trituberculatus]
MVTRTRLASALPSIPHSNALAGQPLHRSDGEASTSRAVQKCLDVLGRGESQRECRVKDTEDILHAVSGHCILTSRAAGLIGHQQCPLICFDYIKEMPYIN